MVSLVGPVTLRGRTAPSRVLFGPHETNLGHRREFSARHVAYYARRAAGGAGIVVTEIASVHDSDHPYERSPLARDCGAGWAEVGLACRPHGALVLAGLGHAGAQGSTAYGPTVLWGPSRIADVVSREVPMEMEQPEIDALVAGFAVAAALAVHAGLDGVEINTGQHSLMRQFLSGLTNHRVDGYGRDRGRLLREVVGAVRAALGEDRILGLRLCVDELAPWAGITPPQVVAPPVDYVVPVRGSGMSVHATRPDLHTEPGFNRGLCAGVRRRLRTSSASGSAAAVALHDHRFGAESVGSDRETRRDDDHGPLVVLQGSVVDPAMAQAALDEGVADLVEMTRAQIAEPDLVALVRGGHPGRIRPSTLSNQRTAVRDVRNPIVSDDAEPGAGHETDDLPVQGRDPRSRDVLVVGGGPAGLEAARVLALRGHRVRLAERDGVLGGALRLAAAVPGRGRFGLLVDWWERELHRLGVEVHTGTEVTAADLGGAALLATGSRAAPPPFPSGGPVLDAASFVRTDPARLPTGPVLVHDPIGDWTGVGIAEQLAAAGRSTVLVTPDPVAGTQLARTGDLTPANARLERAGVTRAVLSALRSVEDGIAVLEHMWTGERREVGCALVVDCGARLPEESLGLAHPDLLRAGDCVAPRTVYEAVLEGRRAALSLGAGGLSGAAPLRLDVSRAAPLRSDASGATRKGPA